MATVEWVSIGEKGRGVDMEKLASTNTNGAIF